MSKAILDTSAVVAVIRGERGAERVRNIIEGAKISTLNLAEVVAFLTVRAISVTSIEHALREFPLSIEGFDWARAIAAGLLVRKTRHLGLSLADRACVALGIELALPVFTADRAWSKLDLPVEIQVIR